MNFVFFSEENTISINDSSSVVLHDVLPSGQNKGMENAGLDSIWSQIETTTDSIGSHFWVAESDVVDALFASHSISQHYHHVSTSPGASVVNATKSPELQMLYGRTRAGTTGKFTASLLDQPASPEISVVPIRSEEQTQGRHWTPARCTHRMRRAWLATNQSITHCDDGLPRWKTQRLKMSLPIKGSRTLASPSTHTFGASGRILPQLMASRNRAPERLPSCSGAVVM